METKEAIEEIKKYVRALEILKEPESKLYTALKKVIELLQRGEKFEKMWGELIMIWGDKGGKELIMKVMIRLHDEYFPKGK